MGELMNSTVLLLPCCMGIPTRIVHIGVVAQKDFSYNINNYVLQTGTYTDQDLASGYIM
jgi:hypothetical protein